MWTFVNAVARGTSHARLDVPCQDDCLIDVVSVEGRQILVAVAADGAGSASRSHIGSGIVCAELFRCVEATLRSSMNAAVEISPARVDEWLTHVRSVIAKAAAHEGFSPREFASTVLLVVVDELSSTFVQLGDGAIVVGAGDELDVVFWPEAGEYANMTHFLTDEDWREHVLIRNRQSVERVAVMTDGLQRLALQFENRTPYVPFFRPMFDQLSTQAAGFAESLEPDLRAFLDNDSVNRRTDDDKTLVLACRAYAPSDEFTTEWI